ncbi:methyltransferase [Viridibacillus sp. YIM B01967]|uniref:Methyltransferase n=1 Tax=Viridibacillus soli TaxID=2798301 RepID=A0ABS1HAS7_9BACL|nr:methyltransferase [Viridibacillus soli]MBK3496546.1 methyltransferase [Viridibacillus soli]
MKPFVKGLTATVLATTFVTTILPVSSTFAANNEPIMQTQQEDVTPLILNNMDVAVQAALTGPEVKKLKVFDHEFNVKPAYISKSKNLTIVNGQISHHLSYRPDDQFYYRIEKENNEIKKIDIQIDRGGWTVISAPLLALIAQYNGIPLTPEVLKELGQKMGQLMDGRWEYAAEAIVSNIALHVE